MNAPFVVELPRGSFSAELVVDETIPAEYTGWISARRFGDDWGAKVGVRPDLAGATLTAFARWASIRLERLITPDGSEPDEWHHGPDGHKLTYGRLVDLPPLD